MSARHKLQPRLLRSNPNTNQIHLQRTSQTEMDQSYILARAYLQTFESRGKRCFTKIQCGAIQKFKSSRNLHATTFIHDVHEDTQDNSPSSNEEDEVQECQEYNTDQDLEPPTDDLLDFISSQEHSDDQLDQVLQTYQAYQESQTESQSPTRQLHMYHLSCCSSQPRKTWFFG